MLLGQELKFKNKLCNLKLGTFFSALPGGGSLTHSQALALSKRARDVTALLGARNRYAIRLADQSGLRQVCGLGPPSYYLAKGAGYYPYFKTTLGYVL